MSSAPSEQPDRPPPLPLPCPQVKDLQAGNETLAREMKRILGDTTPETVGLTREWWFVRCWPGLPAGCAHWRAR